MNPPSDPNFEQMPDWYDPFEEPRTIPGGWDLSEMPARKSFHPKHERLPEWYDPFRDTRTFPSGWDLS